MGRLALVVVVVTGCTAKPSSPPPPPPVVAPVPTAVAPAPDAGEPFCVPKEFNGAVAYLAADDRQVTLCLRGNTDARCGSVDLATGTWSKASLPPPAPRVVAHTITDDATGVRVCRADGTCTELAIKPLPAHKDEPRNSYYVDVSADGSRAVATVPNTQKLLVFDLATGKQVAKIDASDAAHRCVGSAAAMFLGDTIYSVAGVCNETIGHARFYDKTGKLLAKLDKLDVGCLSEPAICRPLPLDGTRWAIPGFAGVGFEIVDVATGAVTSLVDTMPNYPVTCCQPINSMAPDVTPLARTPAGRLVEATAGIAVMDDANTKLATHHPLPICH